MKVTQVAKKGELVMYEDVDKNECPSCRAFAVVPLTPSQLAKQPDDTTHVCHPSLGGCNQGYSIGAR